MIIFKMIKGKFMSEQNRAKQFDLEVILTVSTGMLLTDMDNLYTILSHLTGESICTHQIPEILPMASQYVLDTYPQLREVVLADGQIKSKWQKKLFIAKLKVKYGTRLPLTPISKNHMYAFQQNSIKDCENPGFGASSLIKQFRM